MADFSWTQPTCAECFERQNPDRKPVAIVVEFREDENCVYCGERTKDGLYVRIDPDAAPFPTRIKASS